MTERTHATMEQAQAACRKLRRVAPRGRSPEADAIEAQWRGDHAYEGDYAWLTRMQAGAHYHDPRQGGDR